MGVSVAGPETDVPVGARHGALRRTRHPVAVFLVRRIGAGLLTLFVASILIFLATNALPGDVATTVLGRNATPERVELLTERLDLEDSLASRYWDWFSGVIFHGDLGDSAVALAQNSPDPSVSTLISTPLENSLVLAVIAMILLIPMGLLLGTVAGLRAGKTSDRLVSYSTLVLAVLPEFVLGTFLILVFFTWLDVFPPVSLVPPGTSPLAEPKNLVLPVLTLLGLTAAYSARQVRAGVIEVVGEDHVTMALLDGLPRRQVVWRYVLRNSLAPSIQSFAQSLTYLLGGIIVVEVLFSYPGIGTTLVNVVTTRDVTVVQSVTLILAAAYIFINIVADLLVVLLVPKLRTSLR